MQPPMPRDGDVLITNPTATLEHEIGIVPNRPHLTCATHDLAIAEGRRLAEELGVDLWLTEDFSHFLSVATFRP